jgi:hypothetical protein
VTTLINGYLVGAADALEVSLDGSGGGGSDAPVRFFPALAPEPADAPPRKKIGVAARDARLILPWRGRTS